MCEAETFFVMAGHEGGIVTLGNNLEDALDVVRARAKGIIALHLKTVFMNVSPRVMTDEPAARNKNAALRAVGLSELLWRVAPRF